jgi:hypothetical protein
MRRVLPLLLIAVTAAACGTATTSAPGPVVPPTNPSVTSGGPTDACKYLTQADAESMLGTTAGPGKLEHVLDTDATCAYTPKTSTVQGVRVALTVYSGDFVGQTVSDFKEQYKDMRSVDGLGFPAVRTADGAVFAAQNDKRACTLIMSITKPADPDAFARKAGTVCTKALDD